VVKKQVKKLLDEVKAFNADLQCTIYVKEVGILDAQNQDIKELQDILINIEQRKQAAIIRYKELN
jgi:hypothetical protein